MQLTDAGPKLYQKSVAAASLTFQPLLDRAAKVTRLLIDNVSGNDTWIVTVNSREIFRAPIYTVGNNQLFGGLEANLPKYNDFFAWFTEVFGYEYSIQVPLGMTFQVSSVGGATANIAISYEEFTPNDLSPSGLNHPNGNHFIIPVFGAKVAAITAAGENALDTQIAPIWMPPVMVPSEVPAGFNVKILGLFIEAGGINTFSAAADHKSVTDHLAFVLNGQRMFTRVAGDGIPIVGAAAAGGSGNGVYNGNQVVYPAFQFVDYVSRSLFPIPLTLPPGTTPQWFLGITGDVTGGADYSKFLVTAVVDVTQTAANVFGG